MDELLRGGIEQILWLQSHGTPGLDAFFHHFTSFGGRHYLFMLPLLIWCIDFRTGSRVLFWMAFTLFLNSLFKDAIAQPRPFQMDERILSDGELGYGLPSGHAQLVVIFWGVLAAWVGRRWFSGLSIAVMLLMGFSRVYLGVHFPTDVYAGLALGAGTLFIALRTRESLESWLTSKSRVGRFAILLAVSLSVLVLNSASFESGLMIGCAGIVLGGGIGLSLGPSEDARFRGRGPAWQRALRYLLGMALLLLLVGLGRLPIEGSGEGFARDLMIFSLVAALGLWLTAGAPWLFSLVRLSDAGPSSRVRV